MIVLVFAVGALAWLGFMGLICWFSERPYKRWLAENPEPGPNATLQELLTHIAKMPRGDL